MMSPETARLLAAYNQSVNATLYEDCARLTDAARNAPTGGTFGSIHGLLSHLVWGDQMWMHRFTGRPAPEARFGEILETDFDALRQRRSALDAEIVTWANSLTPEWLAEELAWTSVSTGQSHRAVNAAALLHVFNHQTHHRGQITQALNQAGQDYGAYDLIFLPGLVT